MDHHTPVLESLFKIKLQPEACNFIQNQTLAQVFFCESCGIFKNNFSHRTTPLTTFETQSFNCKSRKIANIPVDRTLLISGREYWIVFIENLIFKSHFNLPPIIIK